MHRLFIFFQFCVDISLPLVGGSALGVLACLAVVVFIVNTYFCYTVNKTLFFTKTQSSLLLLQSTVQVKKQIPICHWINTSC